jgi:membrane associated rhomboid family serine protease
MERPAEIPLRTISERKLAEEWALVLAAEGLLPSVQRAHRGYVLAVPAEEAERADAILSVYESENPVEPKGSQEPVGSGHLELGLAISAALPTFFLVTGPRNPSVRWFEAGGADAERILSGELWRTITALTLHADLAHVAGNALAAGVFVTAVLRTLGPGLGLASVLLAGAGGNLVNAALHGSSHVSVGASTAVFGAVGLLAGASAARRRRQRPRARRAWIPLAAGLALLAMLGTSEHVDLWAHLFGLLVGSLLGVALGRATERPRARVQWLLGISAGAVILYCWALALA